MKSMRTREIEPGLARSQARGHEKRRRSLPNTIEEKAMETTISTLKGKPESGTREWACKNINIIDGCAHDCRYCYAKEMAIRFKRATVEGWRNETLRAESAAALYTKYEGTIMFPSAHDITPKNLDHAILALQKLLVAGNKVLIVTKPHQSCVERICTSLAQYKSQIEFRFTIGSLDSETLKFWEPGAPSFEERLAALRYAHRASFKTSISCEPFFDEEVEDLILLLENYTSHTIWLGMANSLSRRLTINGHTDAETLERAKYLKEVVYSDANIRRTFSNFCADINIRWKGGLKKAIQRLHPDFPMF
jgi:DNA repair photolyase